MTGCFSNTRHDRWLENQVWEYYDVFGTPVIRISIAIIRREREMDEKERRDISNRARDFELSKPLASPHLSYSKGALDQDPISRKKRTEEILDYLADQISDESIENLSGKEMLDEVYHLIRVKYL